MPNMANNVNTNLDPNLMDSCKDSSLKDVDVSTSANSDFNLEENTKFIEQDEARSPASSTYADCEEVDSSINENQKEIIITDVHIKILSNNEEEKCVKNDSFETCDNEAKVNSDKFNVEKTDEADNIPQVLIDENDYTDTHLEKCADTDAVMYKDVDVEHDVDEKIENEDVESDLYKEDQELTDKNFDCSERRESFEKDDHENDEYNDFDNSEQEQENDRENGDGQEINEKDAAAQKKLDDDEDRRNPQYIPKKGFFYEHDDRTECNSSDDESADGMKKKESEPKELELKGRGRHVIPDGKWQHDLYKDEEQKPKSTQELIDIYGYDIRNEESAPKARRRRKYGRGPNKYTRKWDDEDAYAKQMLNKHVRPPRQKLPNKQEEYETQFPTIKEQKSSRGVRSKEIAEVAGKRTQNHSSSRSDNESKYNSPYPEKTKNFTKQVSNSTDRFAFSYDAADSVEIKQIEKPVRTSLIINMNKNRSRGRGIGHGKSSRYNSYESEGPQQSSRMLFTSANRGRAQRLPRPNQQQFPVKLINENDVRELSNQISSIDLKSLKRTIVSKNHYGADVNNGEVLQNQMMTPHDGSSAVRSKRYSHQRQRLLPNSNIQSSVSNVNVLPTQNVQSVSHAVQNIQSEGDLCQPEARTHTSMSYVAQTQLTSSPQNSEPSLSVNAPSISSSSLAVSASLIPLSAPPLTASAAPLSANAPPLPIVGFFQHPQDPVIGFTNQGTPAQLYTRDQSVMGGPSNQPVQLVAFLPASPMLPNTNHTQSAPPPPPPPPPPSFPTSVMNYPQPSQAQQSQPSFNSESYSIPPVTLAPLHQTPEMYQSRGGVTYYNTRSQFKPRSPPPPRVKLAIPIVPPPRETMK